MPGSSFAIRPCWRLRMISPRDEFGRASEAIADRNQSQRLAPNFLQQPGKLAGIDLRALPPGAELTVETLNSRYRLLMLDGDACETLIQGGRYFCEETEVRIDGAILSGSVLKIGWICLGHCVELSVAGIRLITTRVRAIDVQPSESVLSYSRSPQVAGLVGSA